MRKISVFLSVLLFLSYSSFAQVTLEPEFGFNHSNLSIAIGDNDAELQDAQLGINFGVGVKYALNKSFYLKPGLYYHGLNVKTNLLESVSKNITTTYLQLPVSLGYQYGFKDGQYGAIFGEVSPYIGYAIAGRTKTGLSGGIGSMGSSEKMKWGSEEGEWNRLDAGVKFGLGYEMPIGLFLKAGYSLGLANIENIDNVKMHHRNWNFSFGYVMTF